MATPSNVCKLNKRYLTKSGETTWVELTLSAIQTDKGDIRQLIGMVLDMDEQKQSEDRQRQLEIQLRQAQKMESIGNLAGGIAHDFNNILSSIMGYTELSLADVAQGSDIESHLKEIYSAGKRAEDLVKQILTFARKTDQEIKPVSPGKIGVEILKLLRSATPTTIDIQSDFKTDAYVMGNPTQLHQVFMNLCTNAIQSMEDSGGTLKVSLSDETIDSGSLAAADLNPGQYVIIKISDTGKGIPQENIDSIFDPYFTTKDPTGGTGLGLSTVHGVVKSYGGKITVQSQVNQGSVFNVYLPVAPQQQNSETKQIDPLLTGTERLLFVDDEEAIASAGGQILSRLAKMVRDILDAPKQS